MSSERDSLENLLSRPASPVSSGYGEKQAAARRNRYQSRFMVATSFVLVSLIGNIALLFSFYKLQGNLALKEHPQQLPYPGREAIRYKQTVFTSSVLDGNSPYQGYPTEESEKLWMDLYHPLFSRISYDEARRMPNKTAGESNNPESGYIISQQVFHDLHCIHSMRTFMYHFADPAWNSTSNPYTQGVALAAHLGGTSHALMPEHLDHCMDALRQSAMCTADIAPNVFQYSPRFGQVRSRAGVLHECRDFDRIKQWAIERDAGEFKGFGDGPEVGKCAVDYPDECE